MNDSSPDGVAGVIEALKKKLPFVHDITLLRNFGQHNALLAGIRAAKYDRIITMDDDGQHPAVAIPQLVESLTDSLDLVYAGPLNEKRGVLRGFASASVKYFLTKTLGVGGAVNISSFRIFRTILRTAFEKYNVGNHHCVFTRVNSLVRLFSSFQRVVDPLGIGRITVRDSSFSYFKTIPVRHSQMLLSRFSSVLLGEQSGGFY